MMRGANCWTDHKLVREKLNIVIPRCRGKGEMGCTPFAVHELASSVKRVAYCEKLEQHLQASTNRVENTCKQNWDTLKECIVEAAEEAVGRGRRKHPEWFEESSEALMPLIEAKNWAHQRALHSNTIADRKEFRRHQRLVKRAVDKANEDWICGVAKEAEAAVKDGRTRWERIRRLQQAHAGRRSIKPSAVWKEDGTPTRGNEEAIKR